MISFAAFSCTASASAGQLAYVIQAPVYRRPALELSYTVSAQTAGVAVGPLLTAPLAYYLGRSSVIFWSIVCALGCSVWSALMTGHGDYIPFLVSRVFSGVSAGLPTVLGSSIIMDIFYLHKRGTAFLVYSIAVSLGTISGSTFGGFIVGRQSWTVCFWWPVPLLAIAGGLALVFLEETHFDRSEQRDGGSHPINFLSNRMATFLPGTKVTQRPNSSTIIRHAAAPFLVGFSPAIAIIGIFLMIIFGWALIIDILSPLFLQTPLNKGGYAFTATQNAGFSFAEWIGLFVAQAFGSFFNDALPLWICKRYRRGVWTPELRLYCLCVPIAVLPVGLGIIGAAFENHYHYMVLALGVFLVIFAALLAQPIVINYAVECFMDYATECTIAIAVYRLGWGVAIPFYIAEWEKRVHLVWVFGMAAFLTLAVGLLVVLLVWKGHFLRRFHLVRPFTEEGLKVQ